MKQKTICLPRGFKAPPAAQSSKICLRRLTTTLSQLMGKLAAANRQLQRRVAQRKLVEDASSKRGKHHQKCLEESLELQKRLRRLTHRVIAAQEDERKKISRELQDNIAQTLLGINIRLLALKLAARNNSKGLKQEITSTQQLVAQSAKSVRQIGRQIGNL
jgi:signal transduction histidine kinase